MFATCIATATVNWIRRELSQVSFLESKTPPHPPKVHSFIFLFMFIALYLYTCAYLHVCSSDYNIMLCEENISLLVDIHAATA